MAIPAIVSSGNFSAAVDRQRAGLVTDDRRQTPASKTILAH